MAALGRRLDLYRRPGQRLQMKPHRPTWLLLPLAIAIASPGYPAGIPAAAREATGHYLLWQRGPVRVVKLSVPANSVSGMYTHAYALLSFPVSGREVLQGVTEPQGSEELAWQPLPPRVEAFASHRHCVANLNPTGFLSVEVEIEGLSPGLKPRWNGSRSEEQTWRFGTTSLKLLTVLPGASVRLPANNPRGITVSLGPVSLASADGATLGAEAAAVVTPGRDGLAWKNVTTLPAQLLMIEVAEAGPAN